MSESKQMKAKSAKQKRRKGRARTFIVGAINITMHPHDKTSYLELLLAARRSRTPVQLYAKSFGKIGVFTPLDKNDPNGPHYGEFHRYISIDVDGKWYDTEKESQAEDADVKKVVIPPNLKPEYEPYRFVFYPEMHRLFFEVKTYGVDKLTPNHAKKLLDGLFANDRILNRFGKIEVIVEPSADSIDRILGLQTLRTLSLRLTRPNTDDLSRVEQDVYARMDAESADIYQEIYEAEQGGSLTPTANTKLRCRVAASNGEVVGRGRDDKNRSITVKTTDYPWTEKDSYLSSIEDGREAFLTKAAKMLNNIRERIRSDGSARR